MSYPFDKDVDNAGKSVAKRLTRRLGNDREGFRTAIEYDVATGEERMLRTKGGMPEITVKKKKATPPSLDLAGRTFTFKIVGSGTAVVANKAGAGMARLGDPFVAKYASYFVLPWKKTSTVKWNDVIRIDNLDETGTADVILNHAVFTERPTTKATFGTGKVPYAHRVSGAYAATIPGTVSLSPLFIGGWGVGGGKVSNIQTDGDVSISVSTFYPVDYCGQYTAGVRVKPDGTYVFYAVGAKWMYSGLINSVDTMVSTVKTGVTFPYLAETSHVVNHALLGYVEDASVSASAPATGLPPSGLSGSGLETTSYPGPIDKLVGGYPGSIEAGTCTHYTKNYSTDQSQVIPEYGYAGSDVEMTFSSYGTVTAFADFSTSGCQILFKFTSPPPYNEPSSLQLNNLEIRPGAYAATWLVREQNMSSGFELTTALNPLKPLVKQEWSSRMAVRQFPYTWDYTFAWNEGAGRMEPSYSGNQTEHQEASEIEELTVQTTDYLYADIDEAVFITFESTIYSYINFWGSDHTGGLRAKFVVSVRGVETEFPVKFDPLPMPPVTGGWNRTPMPGFDDAALVYDGRFEGGYRPPPIFNPPFMGQGDCPFIAYTTKAEEASGVPAEFYLDMSVLLVAPLSAHDNVSDGATPGYISYVPLQFDRECDNHVIGSNLSPNYMAWTTVMFPPGRRTTALQMCNGVKGPWASTLGPEFSGSPQLDISRI